MRVLWNLSVINTDLYKLVAVIMFFAAITGSITCEGREHGQVEVTTETFLESSRELTNPNRGFYSIYGFMPSDGEDKFEERVNTIVARSDKSLVMVQVNLRNYTTGPISEKGLENIQTLFEALENLDKQYIVRFLYDWDGRNLETEPQEVEIILSHMRQLEDIFREYSDIIFIQQGLFVGNWGELNGTIHYSAFERLALQLAAVTDETTFLAVRTPSQWRTVTGREAIKEAGRNESSLACRLSLYNDGILGNIWDCGTYGSQSKLQAGTYGQWNREEELAFQEELCKLVPNGGEVIIENPLNDFENAISTFRTMHLTYLNWDYDRRVLNKWKESTYSGNDCFNGMDGLSYIERHLGYRLLIADNSMKCYVWPDFFTVSVDIKNVGFAPMYKEPEAYITVRNKENGKKFIYTLDTSLCSLAGGNESEEILNITKHIPLTEYQPGIYEVYLLFRDADSGNVIELAHEQEPEKHGYLLGRLVIEEKKQEE